jgi:putative intracellular protease/amidase
MSTPRALFVVTSHATLGSTGKPTGAYLSEISHVHAVLRAARVEVDFVSPKGGKVPLDGIDRTDATSAAFLDDADAMGKLGNSLRPDQVDTSQYTAIYFAGGHGTMWDLPDDTALAALTARIYEQGGIVAAVCHGPSGLVNVKLANGTFLVAGKEVAAFTNEEESAVGLTEIVPFLLADRLVERGAKHVPAAKWANHVVVSERLVTGQNPQSARSVGEAIAKLLAAR